MHIGTGDQNLGIVENYLTDLGMPPIISETLASFLKQFQGESWSHITSHIDTISYSLNDTYILFHRFHEKIGQNGILELSCPYLKEGYSFLTQEEAEQLIEDALILNSRGPIQFISAPVEYRTDYHESLGNW